MVTPLALALRSRAGIIALCGVLVISVSLLAERAGLVPFWDGRIYADCLVGAARAHLAIGTLRCGGHPTQAFVLFAGALQLLAPESFVPMLVAQTCLYLVACAGVYRLAQLAFPGVEHALDRGLVAAMFAAQPVVLASTVQPNVDLPLLPAFMWATVFIIRRQWLLLIASGLALVFTKETGVLLYVTLVAAYLVAMMLPVPSSPRSPTRTVLRLAPLAIPVLVFVAYVAYRSMIPNEQAIWNAGSRRVLLFQFLFPRLSPALANYVALMLVVSFSWLGTTVLLTDGAVAVVRKIGRRAPRPLPGSKRRIVRFIVVLGLATMYALTRFSTWGNARYVLPVFGLTPLMVYASLVRLGIPQTARRAFMVGAIGLLLVSSERSIDPVSRQLYGTFAVGDISMFRMTGLSGECCGAGRDQLVYSLQHTILGDLTSDATEALATDSTVIFVPTLTRWFNIGPLDAATHRRTLRTERVVNPVVMEPDTLRSLAVPPTNAIYIALPNGDPEGGLRELRAAYDIGQPRTVRRGGYWLNTYRLTPHRRRGS